MTELKKADKAIEPRPFENKIPDGAMDPNDVKPGYGPLEGSPNPSDPTKLFNPFNPNSPVTRPSNPSNPANMPAMQSDKTPSEVAMGKTKDVVPPTPEAKKAAEERDKEKAELTKKIDSILKAHDSRETSIPASHEYWAAVNRLRTLSNV